MIEQVPEQIEQHFVALAQLVLMHQHFEQSFVARLMHTALVAHSQIQIQHFDELLRLIAQEAASIHHLYLCHGNLEQLHMNHS